MSQRRNASKEDPMNKTKPRFSNRLYRADLCRTDAGSPIIKIVPVNSKGQSAHYRQVNAFIYDLASEMEKRSEEIGAKWVISPETWNTRVTVELATGSDSERTTADEFVAQLLAERNLA
jgi:hypothetical protein